MTEFLYTNQTDFTYVDSTAVESIYYNSYTEELVVVSRHGAAYKYSDVPVRDYDTFADASSPGKYWNLVKSYHKSAGPIGYNVVFTYQSPTEPSVEYEVTVTRIVTETVRVSANDFNSAGDLALLEYPGAKVVSIKDANA
jgi:hypothetical protein